MPINQELQELWRDTVKDLDSKISENCGVVACVSHGNAASHALKSAVKIQHRGFNSAGIALMSDSKPCKPLIHIKKEEGLISNLVEKLEKEPELLKKSKKTIVHNRYGTAGKYSPEETQPAFRKHVRKIKTFAVAFNGTIANYQVIAKRLLDNGYHLETKGDTEILKILIAKEISRGNEHLDEIMRGLSGKIEGGYAIAILNGQGDLGVARDPFGIRPLCVGKNKDISMAASENVALDRWDLEWESVPPGHIAMLYEGDYKLIEYAKSPRKAVCSLEHTYFANAASTIDGINVNKARERLGVALAKEEFLEINGDYVISLIPASSIPAAKKYASVFGKVIDEAILKDPFAMRIFMLDEGDRYEKLRDKFNFLADVIKDKKIIYIDDSIIRGHTSKMITEFSRKLGAVEVHFRSTFPTVLYTCCSGINTPSLNELIAPKGITYKNDGSISEPIDKKIYDRIAKKIGADSVNYLSEAAFVDALGTPKKDLCLACVNGDYPFEFGNKLKVAAAKAYVENTQIPTYNDLKIGEILGLS